MASRIRSTIALCVGFAIGCNGTFTQQPPKKWQETVVDDGAAKIFLPGKPVESQHDVKVPEGTVTVRIWKVVLPHQEFGIALSKYPPGYIERVGGDEEYVLDNALNALVKRTPGTTEIDRVGVAFRQYPGLEISVAIPEHLDSDDRSVAATTDRVRAYLVDDEMWILIMSTEKNYHEENGTSVDRDFTKFAESFDLTRQTRSSPSNTK